ncbi:MAG TPA: iron ABC transporter permease [Holophagaceae bacterium]|nr:iron ABC transporter permease [Holophagaceae bacterium]
MRIRAGLPLLLLLLAGLLGVVLAASLAFGEVRLSPAEIWAGLAGRDELAHAVLWNLRLPRALVGAAVGAALAASGAVMQALFRNPLASPGLLGVSTGGALGAVLAIALGWSAVSLWSIPLCSLAGAFIATGAVLILARQGAGLERLLLSGIALNALLGAATSFVLTLTAGRFEKSGAMVFWLMGGLEDRTWEHVWMSLPGILLACAMLLPLGRAMNLLALGEQGAQSLGVDVRRLRVELVVLSTVLAALATAVAGVVGFVGLVVPHILRLLLGPDHRRLLPLSMLGGAAFTLACDLAVRMLGGGLRLGVVSSLVGGPFFLWLLRRKP